MKQVSVRKQQLEDRLAHLIKSVAEIADTLDDPVSADFGEQAIEREGDEVLESLGQMEQAEARMIHAALARIEDGTYGDCVKCGDAIREDRLDLLPHTPFCKDCAV